MSASVPPERRGLTLIEIIVVLLLLGLGATLVAPVLNRGAFGVRVRATPLDEARRFAARRGQAATLTIARDGRWTVRAEEADSSVQLSAGEDADVALPARLLVTAEGNCLPLVPVARAWDPLRCRPAAEENAR